MTDKVSNFRRTQIERGDFGITLLSPQTIQAPPPYFYCKSY